MKLLVDTSAWIDHFRNRDPVIEAAINRASLCTHEFVLGELALGSIANRSATLAAIAAFERLSVAGPEQLHGFIEASALASKGIGLVAAHLLLSTTMTPGAKLWTRDNRLKAQAERLDCAFNPD